MPRVGHVVCSTMGLFAVIAGTGCGEHSVTRRFHAVDVVGPVVPPKRYADALFLGTRATARSGRLGSEPPKAAPGPAACDVELVRGSVEQIRDCRVRNHLPYGEILSRCALFASGAVCDTLGAPVLDLDPESDLALMAVQCRRDGVVDEPRLARALTRLGRSPAFETKIALQSCVAYASRAGSLVVSAENEARTRGDIAMQAILDAMLRRSSAVRATR